MDKIEVHTYVIFRPHNTQEYLRVFIIYKVLHKDIYIYCAISFMGNNKLVSLPFAVKDWLSIKLILSRLFCDCDFTFNSYVWLPDSQITVCGLNLLI